MTPVVGKDDKSISRFQADVTPKVREPGRRRHSGKMEAFSFSLGRAAEDHGREQLCIYDSEDGHGVVPPSTRFESGAVDRTESLHRLGGGENRGLLGGGDDRDDLGDGLGLKT